MAFDFKRQCCFCGANNESDPVGYAGERCCRTCGKGGDGEPDELVMAYHEPRRSEDVQDAG